MNDTLRSLAQDVRLALRSIKRAPLFAVIVVSTLAIGIGVNTTMFSIVDTVILRSLPYPGADRIVDIGYMTPSEGSSEYGLTGFEYWATATLFQRVELGLFTVLSQIDFALHVGVAISAINVDHSWYTQGFWYVAFMMLTCILVAWLLVRLVSKITAGGSAAGVELQNKLQTKYESSAALLLLDGCGCGGGC